jgi:hypothetical protein
MGIMTMPAFHVVSVNARSLIRYARHITLATTPLDLEVNANDQISNIRQWYLQECSSEERYYLDTFR